MDKIEPEVANASMFGQLDMCAVIWRLLMLQKWIWDDLNGYGKLWERSTSFMQKSWANKAWILKEIDHGDGDAILSS